MRGGSSPALSMHLFSLSFKKATMNFEVFCSLFDLFAITHLAYDPDSRRTYELFTSLIDAPTDEMRRIHQRLLEGQGGDGMVRRKTFRLLYPSLLKPLVVQQDSSLELALSACLKVALHHYQLS